MVGTLTWEDDGEFYFSEELSTTLRTNVQALTKFRQFATVKDATKKAAHRGDKFHWNRFGDVGVQGRELDELSPIPETSFNVDQAVMTMTEFGNSVPYSGKLERLSMHDIYDIVNRALRNDARKAFDIAAWQKFNDTPCILVPTAGNAVDSVTLTTNGTAAQTNAVALGADHMKAISDLMSSRDIPPFIGDDFIALGHAATFRPLKNDLESIAQYTDRGIDRIYRGEVGRYEGFRYIEQNFIPEGGAQDSLTFDPYSKIGDPWNGGKSSWVFFFGDDTVAEGMITPEQVRAKIPTDYGRSKGIAWYYLGGFGLTHDGATDPAQCRIFKWDSLA